MSRIQNLKESALSICKANKTGSMRRRKEILIAINKFISSLGAIRNVPSKWNGLTSEQVACVVEHWKNTGLETTTIANYLTYIRLFLSNAGCTLNNISNKDLGVKLKVSTPCYLLSIDKMSSITDELIKNLLLLQTEFGLTYSESLRFSPDIHSTEEYLSLTREITRNSLDRAIYFSNDTQKLVVNTLFSLLNNCESAISQYGYNEVRARYKSSLNKIGFSTRTNFRCLYARSRHRILIANHDHNIASKMIMSEMAINKVTLWRYLNEQN